MADLIGTGYADLLEVDRSSGDPLGLSAVSERLYNTVFPGYNNVVRHIRVYSALCWMAAKVEESFETTPPAGARDAKKRQEQAFQKMELALLWANEGVITGLNVAGAGRRFPTDNARQILAFSQWPGKATLRGATYYGPSLTNGLRFIDPKNWRCTSVGRALGAAFATQLGGVTEHRWLTNVEADSATRADIELVKPALTLRTPSEAEKAAFLAKFFPRMLADCVDEYGHPDGRNRWYAVHLVLNAIRILGKQGSSPDEIRAVMARGVTADGTSVLRPGTEVVQAYWAVLQLRQLQRLASETLFSVVFDWVRRNSATGRSVGECIAELVAVAQPHYEDKGIRSTADLEARLKQIQGGHASLYLAAAAQGEPEADLFDYLGRVGSKESRLWGPLGCPAVAQAVDALSFCAVEVANLEATKWTDRNLKKFSTERSSLTALSGAFRANRNHPVTEWIRTLLADWVFGRYYEVAIERAQREGGTLQFAFSCEEAGLQLTGVQLEPFQPSFSIDKLYHTLLLCEQCGLVGSSGSSGEELFFLTAAGRDRVKSYEKDRVEN